MNHIPDLVSFLRKTIPLIFALQTVFGFLYLLDIAGVTYYPMIHRATRVMQFELGFSLSMPLVLLLVCWSLWIYIERKFVIVLFPLFALVLYPLYGIDVSIAIASLIAVVSGVYLHRGFMRFFNYVLLLFAGVEVFSVIHWIVFIQLGLASPLEGFAQVEMGLFYISSYLVPLFVFPLLFMWFIKPILFWGRSETLQENKESLHKWSRTCKRHSMLLFFTVLLGIGSALYSYGPFVNPEGHIVGVDYQKYVEMADIVASDPMKAFTLVGGTRPFFYLFIYGLSLLGFDTSVIIKFLPVILNPLLVISSYYLALETFTNKRTAAWAAFFTVCGYQVTVGMYSYFLSNILGLILIFLSLGSLFRSIRIKSRVYLVVASFLGGLLVFIHPWTFLQYSSAIFFTACVAWYAAYRKRANDKFYRFKGDVNLLVYLTSLGIAEVIKIFLLPGGGGVSTTSTIIRRSANLTEFWWSSIFSFRYLYGGIMASLILIILAIVGVYCLNFNSIPDIFLAILPAVTSAVYLIGDDTLKTRLLYNLPIGVYAALGFVWVLRKKIGYEYNRSILAFVGFNMLAYLFRSLANII